MTTDPGARDVGPGRAPAAADGTGQAPPSAAARERPGAGTAGVLTHWSTIAAVCAGTAFVLERARLHGYSRYYRVPSEFVDIDPRLAYIPVLRALVPVGLLSITVVVAVHAVRLRAVRRAAGRTFRQVGWRASLLGGRTLLWLSAAVAVAVLLLVANRVGDDLGRNQGAQRTVYFVVGQVEPEQTVAVLFMRQDTLLVADVSRASGEDSWRMEAGFRFLALDGVERLTRVRLGQILPAELVDAPAP